MNFRLTANDPGRRLDDIPFQMALNPHLTTFSVPGPTAPVRSSSCGCLADFYREEFLKHHACLERQREYYSDVAIRQAEDALARIMAQLEQLCQRDDACQMVGELLRKFDIVTKLSMWTEARQLH
jgi:hypothetical protein